MLNRIPQLRGMSPWLVMDFRSANRMLTGIQDEFNRKGLISEQGAEKDGVLCSPEGVYGAECRETEVTSHITLGKSTYSLNELGKGEFTDLFSSLWRLILFLPKLIRRLRG